MSTSEMVFIAMGSNLGQREEYLARGRDALAEMMQIEKVSSIYETPPWGVIEQPKYLNQVVQGKTDLLPLDLLLFLKHTEKKIGRTEGVRYGPRVLDLDILFFGEQVLYLENLQIPHPRIAERAFVLVPLNEIAPDFVHPLSGLSISSLLADCPEEEIVRYE